MKKITFTLILFVTLFSVGCAHCKPKTFSNQKDLVKTCADPFILKHDGVYYLYCTAETHLTDIGIPVYKSTDLVNWEGPCGACEHGLALHEDDVWGNSWFWGGDVIEKNGKFYMFATVEERLVVAVSDSPLGPFKQKIKKPMHESKEIDGSVFIDDDGKAYIYFVRFEGANVIYVAELTDDLLKMKDKTIKLCVKPEEPWELGTNQPVAKVAEGAYMIKHKGYYYLVYTANHFMSKDYCVGYATSKSPVGPWKKYKGNPILQANNKVHGPGNGMFIESPDGSEMFFAYHVHCSVSNVWPRKLAIDRARFEKNPDGGHDIIVIYGPTVDVQTYPSNKPATLKKNKLSEMFVVGGFGGPPPEKLNYNSMRDVANAGINVLIPGNGVESPKPILKMLDLAEQIGIKIIPIDLRFFAANTNKNISDKKFISKIASEIVKDYSNQYALLAYGICDEPKSDKFPMLRMSTDIFRKLDPAHPALINLFPSYGSPAQLGFADFRDYVHNFIETVQPSVLSYDHYPLRETETETGWHKDLEIVRDEAQKAGIPFWIFIQSEGIKNYLRVPTRAEIMWQANTALAYGARGILWFCYWTPPVTKLDGKITEVHYSAMIDKNGKRTQVYDFVREENLFLRKAGQGLMDWENIKVSRYKNGKLVSGQKVSAGKLSGRYFDLVVGTFAKENKVKLVFANDSYTKTALFSITGLSDSKETASINSESRISSGKVICKIKPGGCLVMVIEVPYLDSK